MQHVTESIIGPYIARHGLPYQLVPDQATLGCTLCAVSMTALSLGQQYLYAPKKQLKMLPSNIVRV